MSQFNIPSQPTKNTYIIENFLGVDFSSSPIEVDKRRSPNAKNLINVNGYNESRKGYQVLNTIGTRINGVWNIDTDLGDLFLIHSGSNLYQVSDNFQTSVIVLSGMTNNHSVGVYFNDKLIIFDGTRAVIFGKFENDYEAKFLDEVGYIPTTSVSRDKAGGGTDYEPINMLSPYRINSFLPEKIKQDTGTKDENGSVIYEDIDQREFLLDEGNIEEVTLVEQLMDTGEWAIVNNNQYTVDLSKGKVTFLKAPGESPVLGRDSISIRYKKSNFKNVSKINKCTIVTLYGYDGNNNRIFASGNPEFPNVDWHCEQEDPTYWADDSATVIGIEPIINYSRLSDGSLAIQKRHSDTDNTVYYRTYNLLNETEVFPLKDGVKNIGCISKYANANLLNDPLTLTEQGVFAVIGNNGEKYVQQRSYYVNNKLLQEPNLEQAVGIAINGKYYLAINNHIYIADSRYLSYPKHAKTEQYQYEWWYWDNIPARVLFSWNNELYFGTDTGEICGFIGYNDIEKPVEVYWETPFLELNSSNLAKTIKVVTLILNPGGNCDITLGYILDDGSVEIITKNYSALQDDFPKTIQEKEKIKKFMFVKFFFKNKTKNRMTFERLILEYINSGKYRGE